MSIDEKEFIKIWKAGYQAGVEDGYRLCVPAWDGERVDKLAKKAFKEGTES